MKKILLFILLVTMITLVAGCSNKEDVAYAVVSIDINPSVELIIDDAQEVIEIIALNGDAKDVIDEELMLGKPVMDVVQMIIELSANMDYLTEENNDILIASAIYDINVENDDLNEAIKAYLETEIDLEEENVRIFYVESDMLTKEAADKAKKSLGKKALNNLIKGVEGEEDLSVGEMVDATEEDLLDEIVVLDETDDLKVSYLEFVSKLMVVPKEERTDEIQKFVDMLEGLNKDEEGVPTDFPIEVDEYTFTTLVQLKNATKDLWRTVQKDYQKAWAQAHEDSTEASDVDVDSQEADEDLMEGLKSFVSRVYVVSLNETAVEIEDFLDKFEFNDDFSEFTVESEDSLKDLFVEAKMIWKDYQKKYQKEWANMYSESEEAFEIVDAAGGEGEDDDMFESLKVIVMQLDVVSEYEDDGGLEEFLANFNNINDPESFTVVSDKSVKELFTDGKVLWSGYRKTYQKTWNDLKGDEESEAKEAAPEQSVGKSKKK